MSATENAAVKLSRAYASAGGKPGALPWADIIQMIFSLFGGCSTKSAKRFARNHPLALQGMLQDKLKDESDLSKGQRDTLAKAGVDLFNSSSVAAVDAVRDEMGV